VRRGTDVYTLAANTTELQLAGDDNEHPRGIIKPITVTIPSTRRVPLNQVTLDQIRMMDTAGTRTGTPTDFAVIEYAADSCTLQFYPITTEDLDIQIDGIMRGVDLVDDTDIPALPEDFHDAIIYGVCADENQHWDKVDRFDYYEKKSELRVREMRYFIQKSIYLHRHQQAADIMLTSWWWFYGAPIIAT